MDMDDSMTMDVDDSPSNDMNNSSFSSRYNANRVCSIVMLTRMLESMVLFNRKPIDVQRLLVHLVVILYLQVIQEND